jgi:hypothetical protein
MRVDLQRGTIGKSSNDKVKLAREVDYYQMLPESLRVFFPRVVAVSRSERGVDSYEMEYYGYPNLAEYQLYWDLGAESWWRCFEALNSTLTRFRTHSTSIGQAQYQRFHWEKTTSRIASYLASVPDESRKKVFSEEALWLNGTPLRPLRQLLEQAEKIIEKAYRESSFSVFHGDFCFNNILFDVFSGIIRLIDPRGSFGEECIGIYGDGRYDLAKIAHSSIGHYDYLVNGLFDCRAMASNRYELDFSLRPNSQWLEEMTHWLIAAQGADRHEIEIMTSLLFLSMCPLHADDTERQLAMFLRGWSLLEAALS